MTSGSTSVSYIPNQGINRVPICSLQTYLYQKCLYLTNFMHVSKMFMGLLHFKIDYNMYLGEYLAINKHIFTLCDRYQVEKKENCFLILLPN